MTSSNFKKNRQIRRALDWMTIYRKTAKIHFVPHRIESRFLYLDPHLRAIWSVKPIHLWSSINWEIRIWRMCCCRSASTHRFDCFRQKWHWPWCLHRVFFNTENHYVFQLEKYLNDTHVRIIYNLSSPLNPIYLIKVMNPTLFSKINPMTTVAEIAFLTTMNPLPNLSPQWSWLLFSNSIDQSTNDLNVHLQLRT